MPKYHQRPYTEQDKERKEELQQTIEELGAELQAKEEEINKLVSLLNDYEKWEANILSDNRHWGPEVMNPYPTLIESTWDEMLILQDKRNAALQPYMKSK